MGDRDRDPPNTTVTRRVSAAVVAVALLLAGCSGVTPPDSVAVDGPDAYAVQDLDVWTSGETTEYRSTVVVAGSLSSTTGGRTAVPRVAVRFTLASGESRVVNATYSVERRRTAFADLGNTTLRPGQPLPIRAVFDPEGDVTVTNATVLVGDRANETA